MSDTDSDTGSDYFKLPSGMPTDYTTYRIHSSGDSILFTVEPFSTAETVGKLEENNEVCVSSNADYNKLYWQVYSPKLKKWDYVKFEWLEKFKNHLL